MKPKLPPLGWLIFGLFILTILICLNRKPHDHSKPLR